MLRSKSRSAFTLVELLVVIGIIALLISILMPSLRKAREAAIGVTCLSQLRQIGMASRMYANDFSNVLPGPDTYYGTDSPIGFLEWPDYLRGQRGTVSFGPTYIKTATLRPFHCPKNNETTPGKYGMYFTTFDSSWSPNEPARFTKITNLAQSKTFHGYKLNKIRGVTDYMMFGCTSSNKLGDGNLVDKGTSMFRSSGPWSGGGEATRSLWAAHSNRVNGAFADGHAESCDAGRLLQCSNYNGTGTPVRPRGITYWKDEFFREVFK